MSSAPRPIKKPAETNTPKLTIQQREIKYAGPQAFDVGDRVELARGALAGRVGTVNDIKLKRNYYQFNLIRQEWGEPYWAYEVWIEGKPRWYRHTSLKLFEEVSAEVLAKARAEALKDLRELEEMEILS